MKVHLVPVHQFGGYKCFHIEARGRFRWWTRPKWAPEVQFWNVHGFTDAFTVYDLSMCWDICELWKSSFTPWLIKNLGFFFIWPTSWEPFIYLDVGPSTYLWPWPWPDPCWSLCGSWPHRQKLCWQPRPPSVPSARCRWSALCLAFLLTYCRDMSVFIYILQWERRKGRGQKRGKKRIGFWFVWLWAQWKHLHGCTFTEMCCIVQCHQILISGLPLPQKAVHYHTVEKNTMETGGKWKLLDPRPKSHLSHSKVPDFLSFLNFVTVMLIADNTEKRGRAGVILCLSLCEG